MKCAKPATSFIGSPTLFRSRLRLREDGTDLYWARSRVLEYLSSASRRLPAGVAPSLGPDATGVGWVYQYVVRGAQKNLAELRSIQDWYYGIAKAEGVAEVASVGGLKA